MDVPVSSILPLLLLSNLDFCRECQAFWEELSLCTRKPIDAPFVFLSSSTSPLGIRSWSLRDWLTLWGPRIHDKIHKTGCTPQCLFINTVWLNLLGNITVHHDKLRSDMADRKCWTLTLCTCKFLLNLVGILPRHTGVLPAYFCPNVTKLYCSTLTFVLMKLSGRWIQTEPCVQSLCIAQLPAADYSFIINRWELFNHIIIKYKALSHNVRLFLSFQHLTEHFINALSFGLEISIQQVIVKKYNRAGQLTSDI